MAASTLVPTETWFEFTTLCAHRSDGGWFFRGDSSCTHELVPKFGRKLAGKRIYDSNSEIEIFNDFKHHGLRFTQSSISQMGWLALAQHHGLPTRLLDWSTNPLVAAWFAVVNDATMNSDAFIYFLRSIDNNISDSDDKDPFSSSFSNPTLIRAPSAVARITAQQGIFSLHPQPDQAWEPDPALFELERFVIPKDEKAFFRQVLSCCGFNYARMMVDLDGVARDIAWKYRNYI